MVAVLVIALPLTQADSCKTGDAGGSRSDSGGVGFPDPQPYPHPSAGDSAPHNKPNASAPQEMQQPAAPPADEGPYQTPTQAVFVLVWQDERAGSIEHTVNGPVGAQTIPAPQPIKNVRDGKYHGRWTITVAVGHGQVIGFTWFPVNKSSWSMCTLYHNGKIEDYQIAPSGGCAVGFTVA